MAIHRKRAHFFNAQYNIVSRYLTKTLFKTIVIANHVSRVVLLCLNFSVVNKCAF